MKYIGLLGIIGITLLLLLFTFGLPQKSSVIPHIGVTTPTPVANTISLPHGVFPTLPPGTTFDMSDSFATISGVTMNNFAQTSEIIDQEGDISLQEIPNVYTTIYFVHFNQFVLSVTGSPFDTYRIQAEQDFLKQLGITQEEACNLDVVITTPRYANPAQAGQTYPLSFCQK